MPSGAHVEMSQKYLIGKERLTYVVKALPQFADYCVKMRTIFAFLRVMEQIKYLATVCDSSYLSSS